MTISKRRAWLYTGLLVCLLTSYFLRGIVAVEQNTNSSAFDQRSYLTLGLNLRDGRDLTDGKRHPFLPALLSLFAERDWRYYTRAKFLNLFLGGLCLILVYLLGKRWFGPNVGLLTTGLLSLNASFLAVSSRVMAEPLLIFLTLAGWYFAAEGLSTSGSKALILVGLAGLMAGLAYFTKGTALQMVPAFGLAALKMYRKSVWRRREVWLFGLTWVIAWMPLFLFNIREYGNPFYNYNYRHEIFLDSPTQRHFADLSEAPTLQTYLQTHTAADIAYRMWFGLREVTRILVDALGPISPDVFRGTVAEKAWIALWLGLLALLWQKRRPIQGQWGRLSPAFWLFLGMLICSLIPLGWFVQASNVGPRFIILFHPMVYFFTLGALGTVARRWIASKERLTRLGQKAPFVWGVGLALWASISAGRAWPQIRAHPVSIDREANARGQAVLEWLAQSTPYGTRVLWGPSYTLPNWLYERRLSLKDVPSKVQNVNDIAAYARDKKLAYAILDWEVVSRRESAFAGYFIPEYPWVIIEQLPASWALVLPYEGIPANWLILRLTDTVPLANTSQAQVGSLAQLVGYELYPQPAYAGETVYLTLYWRALAQAETDYTVFVHLVDQKGLLKSQHDQQPLEGRYPTSLWKANQLLGDRHALHLPENIEPGEYRFLVGMYSWQTMERLPTRARAPEKALEGAVQLAVPLRVEPRSAQ